MVFMTHYTDVSDTWERELNASLESGLWVSGATNADHVAAHAVHLDDRGLEEARWLPGQLSLEGHTPDTARAGRGSDGLDRLRRERDMRARYFDGALTADFGWGGPCAPDREETDDGEKTQEEALQLRRRVSSLPAPRVTPHPNARLRLGRPRRRA
jgi:hypothetical protein